MDEDKRLLELENLRDHFYSERACIIEELFEGLEESTEFRRGYVYGYVTCADAIIEYLRRMIKYGDSF